jgi:hypothetical protein
MTFAAECRARALIWQEVAERSIEFKEQSFDIAQSWLTLAAIEDLLNRMANDRAK